MRDFTLHVVKRKTEIAKLVSKIIYFLDVVADKGVKLQYISVVACNLLWKKYKSRAFLVFWVKGVCILLVEQKLYFVSWL